MGFGQLGRLTLGWGSGGGLASWLASISALLWGSDHLVDGDGDTLT